MMPSPLPAPWCRLRGLQLAGILADTAATDTVYDALRALLPAADYDVQPWYALASSTPGGRAFSEQLQLVKPHCGGDYSAGNRQHHDDERAERTGEIGTVMALDTTLRGAARLPVEGPAGLARGGTGSTGGRGPGRTAATAAGGDAAAAGFFPGSYFAALRLTPPMMLERCFIACITTTLAALYPALRASRMVIVDAIRHAR